ncbi:MAG TPA: septation protein IspZ [Caulobacteraceae bacterium]|nr:septation protein IspZ [Caulobacteraceae bacterium]
MAASNAKTIRMAVDYAAPIAFVGALLVTRNFQTATWVLVAGSFAALAIGFAVERRLAPLPLFAGLSALVFGGLTLIFHDPKFVKMKLTFIDSALAAGLIGGLMTGRNPLKSLLGDAFHLPDGAWRVLTIRYALFFAACAVANEAVWRTQSDARWGIFRLVLLGAALVFSFAQTPFLMKHGAFAEDAEAPEPPDPGF